VLNVDNKTLAHAIALAKAEMGGERPPEFEDTFRELGWSPYPKQQKVIDAVQNGVYAILAGGAAGGGKSSLGRTLAVAICRRYAGVRIGIFRRTYPELHRTHEIPISNLPRRWGRWFSDPHEFHFTNGSILELAAVERDTDLGKYQSAEYNALILDEMTQLSWYMITFLNARIRSTDASAPKFLLGLTNPGGESHAQVKQTFVDAAEPEEVFQATIGESKFPAIFLPFRLEDNEAMLLNDPGYRDRILAMPEHLRRAWLYGDWDVFVGGFFDEWFKDKHVIKPFDIPRSWPRWRAVDFGYANPFACVWGARDNDGNIYIYREAYERRLTDWQQAKLIQDMSAQDPPMRFTIVDPSMFSKQPNGRSTAQVYVDAGLRGIIPGNNDRRAGWQRMREFLKWDEDRPPKLRIFSTCKNLIRTIPLMQYDKYRTEDLDTSLDDHIVDALRYLLMGGTISSRSSKLLDFHVVGE